MFVKEPDAQPLINSVVAVEGSFKYNPSMDEHPDINLLMMYMNNVMGESYGTCPARTPLFSKETMDHFKEFLLSAEKDFGEYVLNEGEAKKFSLEPASVEDQAASNLGLPKGLGG